MHVSQHSKYAFTYYIVQLYGNVNNYLVITKTEIPNTLNKKQSAIDKSENITELTPIN